MRQQQVEIVNKLGLHARAAAKLTQLAMMLAAGKGSRIVLETDGPDESEALDAIVALIGDCFGEGG